MRFKRETAEDARAEGVDGLDAEAAGCFKRLRKQGACGVEVAGLIGVWRAVFEFGKLVAQGCIIGDRPAAECVATSSNTSVRISPRCP